jgi:tetratricopeptide (TPR) repeat protein
VPPGEYQLRVTDLYGNEIKRDFVFVSGQDTFAPIRLALSRPARPISGTVSARELQRKISPKALKEFRKAEQAHRKGALQQSVEHLQNAIQADPSFADAYEELGACYVELNQLDRAVPEFQKALEQDPDSTPAAHNLSAVFFRLGRYPEAEKAARRALGLNRNLAKAHYVLGLSLRQQNRIELEALEHLQHAEREFPTARLGTAEILARQGHRAEATDELRKYLQSSGKVPNRQAVESWLRDLQQ